MTDEGQITMSLACGSALPRILAQVEGIQSSPGRTSCMGSLLFCLSGLGCDGPSSTATDMHDQSGCCDAHAAFSGYPASSGGTRCPRKQAPLGALLCAVHSTAHVTTHVEVARAATPPCARARRSCWRTTRSRAA